MVVYLDNISYEALLNMPSDMRELIARAHNAKVEKQNNQNK